MTQNPRVVTDGSTDPAPSSATLEKGMRAVEKLMHDVVNSDVAILRDASRHILDAGGKRIRPKLVLLTYSALGGRNLEHVVPVAAAIELVHTASVVHDDINDHGIVRRGRPSVNSIWGRTFALLTGDFLFTKVYELMAPYRDLNVILAEATVALVEGETLQASAVKEGNFSRETYYKIIARKTAALFKAAAYLGAKLANATEDQVKALGQYGFNIGLAFQIVDDLLDLTADTAKLGKTAGIDVPQGKGFAVAYANGSTNGVAVADPVEANEADPMAAIRRKILRGDVVNEARTQAHQLALLASTSLNVLPPSSEKEALLELARLVTERDY
jgi:geranylgeranyl pyrophosphate synthase